MSTIAITVDGVLRKPVGGQIIQAGKDLYFGLASRTKVVLFSDTQSEMEDEELAYWLRVEGMHQHGDIYYLPSMARLWSVEDQRVWQARQVGFDLQLVIEPDPSVSAVLFHNGFTTLTYSSPSYSMPHWRPDYEHKPRSWDELSQQVAAEALRRATDERKTDNA